METREQTPKVFRTQPVHFKVESVSLLSHYEASSFKSVLKFAIFSHSEFLFSLVCVCVCGGGHLSVFICPGVFFSLSFSLSSPQLLLEV